MAAAAAKARLQRLVIWDFDDTILRIHACGLLISPAAAAVRPLEGDVADLPFFRSCVDAVVAHGHLVAVASFGHYAVIQAYMDRICPGRFSCVCRSRQLGPLCVLTPPPNRRSNISTPTEVGIPDGFEVPAGKVLQLEKLLSTLVLGGSPPGDANLQQVVFFDDSQRNVDRAIAAGYEHSYVVPKGGFTRAAWERMGVRPEDADLLLLGAGPL